MALKKLKRRKTAGYDGVFAEFLSNCDCIAKEYFTKLFNNILDSKHGKSGEEPSHIRPISLLSVTYKLLERLIFYRIAPTIETVKPHEQADFRPKRSCCEKVVALTNHTEDIHIGEKESHWRTISNGLSQGSVLPPLLFNLYIHDIPTTNCRRFQYADDMALVGQTRSISECKFLIDRGLMTLETYFQKWKLQPNPSQTESCCFHLNNREANTHLQATFCGQLLRHNNHPKYLGVTLDRSLTFTWINSVHTNQVDIQHNRAMRIISGTLQPTPTTCLPVLANIAPPKLRRETALRREFNKYLNDNSLPIHKDIAEAPEMRLRSRKPPRLDTHREGRTNK
ncbi:hypothetical protein J437_LFUL013987 [Ladona fulva]|uniref:Reverse transcriptase domain-containing protein n=1 Tax=Ladona fulva TaxID=123851 RepID=A0A8K0P1M0_LADFU|nr:hypothetical protein J437_LFUL013987 [Ladona fulva]